MHALPFQVYLIMHPQLLAVGLLPFVLAIAEQFRTHCPLININPPTQKHWLGPMLIPRLFGMELQLMDPVLKLRVLEPPLLLPLVEVVVVVVVVVIEPPSMDIVMLHCRPFHWKPVIHKQLSMPSVIPILLGRIEQSLTH